MCIRESKYGRDLDAFSVSMSTKVREGDDRLCVL